MQQIAYKVKGSYEKEDGMNEAKLPLPYVATSSEVLVVHLRRHFLQSVVVGIKGWCQHFFCPIDHGQRSV